MPPEKQVNKDFMKQVLIGEKSLKKKNQINYIHVPGYEELSANRLWIDLQNDQAFNIYFQESYADMKAPCRDYFFNILNTIYPDYLKSIMDHANKERHSAEGSKMKEQTIRITDEWYNELKSMPFSSKKNGKMLNLLKASSKVINRNKRRKVIPLLGNIRDYHASRPVSAAQSQHNQQQ